MDPTDNSPVPQFSPPPTYSNELSSLIFFSLSLDGSLSTSTKIIIFDMNKFALFVLSLSLVRSSSFRLLLHSSSSKSKTNFKKKRKRNNNNNKNKRMCIKNLHYNLHNYHDHHHLPPNSTDRLTDQPR